jgi:hypothetical protein
MAEMRVLGTMPLHAITSVHGEAGLRERLLLGMRFLAADFTRAEERWRWRRGYAGDRRQREPYRNHYAHLRVMPTWRRELLMAA